jgi:hypothetical protein
MDWEVISDNGQTVAVRLHTQENRCLQGVRVLVFVDEDVVESGSNFCRQARLLHHMAPIEKQIVVVEHVVALLCNDVGAEKLFEFVGPIGAPWKCGAKRHRQFATRINRVGIDRQARILLWEALCFI